MKRDMDLIRAILLEAEAHQGGGAPRIAAIEGYTDAQIDLLPDRRRRVGGHLRHN